MASINFLLSGVGISGGFICVMNHAAYLKQRGYDVHAYSMSQWDPAINELFPASVRDISVELLTGAMPPADIQVATHYTTVPTVAQSPARLRAQFVQHVETLFAVDIPEPGVLAPYIEATYKMPLYRICNSSWSRKVLSNLYGYAPDLALNAVDTAVYFPSSRERHVPAVVVSFSDGRKWKGTQDTYDALVLARSMAPDLDIQWHSFGGFKVADAPWIHHHGILSAADLNRLYNQSDVVLSLSWAESYPLPPIEAMAAGRIVISTQFGTEDYLHDGVNGFTVPSRSPLAAAEKLVSVLTMSDGERANISAAAVATAHQHNWPRASAMFEQALRRGLEAGIPPRAVWETEVLESLGIPTITY